MLFAISVSAQNSSSPKHEIGVNLISYGGTNWLNSYYLSEPPKVNYLNGIFYRYTKGRMAYRGKFEYLNFSNEFKADATCKECMQGSATNKRFEISVGAQFALFERKSFPYLFGDVFYYGSKETGQMEAGFFPRTINFKNTTYTGGIDVGCGYKIKVLKWLFLNPELRWAYGATLSNRVETHFYSQTKELKTVEHTINSMDMTMRATVGLSVVF
jgi:hypothetical protein